MMFELLVNVCVLPLSYKSTCVSFVLNPKAPKVMAIYVDSSYQEWFLCLKVLYLKSWYYLIQRIIIRPTFNVMATICMNLHSLRGCSTMPLSFVSADHENTHSK